MTSSFPQLSILEKSVKLTTILQSLHTFSSCLSDLSWLFSESLHIIQEFARESAEYYKDRKSKRIRVDNIQKEYLSLKLRFDSVDLHRIQIFIEQLAKEQSERRKPSHGTLRPPSVSSRREKKENEPWSSTFRDINPLISSHQNLIEITERETLGKKEQELNQRLNESNEQMRHLNHQISRLKEENNIFRDEIGEMKKHIVILTDIVHNKRVNELSTVEKIKGIIKLIKDKNSPGSLQLDKVLYGLIEYEARLKEDTQQVLASEFYEPMESQETKRNNLMLEINTILREMHDLKDEKSYVEQQIEELAELYQQKKGGKTLPTNNTIGCYCGITDNGNDQMLLLQAIAIQRLLDQS